MVSSLGALPPDWALSQPGSHERREGLDTRHVVQEEGEAPVGTARTRGELGLPGAA